MSIVWAQSDITIAALIEVIHDLTTYRVPIMGRAVHTVHTACRVSTACSYCVRSSADDGLRRVDNTCRPVVSGDPHVPPSVWGDHSDAAGRCHDPRSSHRQRTGFWDGVSSRVEGLRRGCYQPTTPDVPVDQKDKKTTDVHSGWLTSHFDTCLEDAEDDAVQRYARSCLLSYE
jgi:hypothetical protein